MNTDRLILVTGATGRQGGAVAEHLIEAGFKVRALTRNPAQPAAQRLDTLGAEIVVGNLDDPASLARAAQGAYGVYAVQNFWEKGVGYEGEVRQGRRLADAAKQAGIQHFVQGSIANADRAPQVEHFASKYHIEQYIDALGLPRTFVGAVFFMENFLNPAQSKLIFPILGGALKPQTRLHMISVADIGAITTRVFQQPERFIGKSIEIAGDRLTVAEMKAIYRKLTGLKPRSYTIPPWISQFLSKDFIQQLRWNNEPGWTFDLDDVKAIYPDLTTFEQFVRKHNVRNL